MKTVIIVLLCNSIATELYHRFVYFNVIGTNYCIPCPCKNEGQCHITKEKPFYHCTCKRGFYGDTCESKFILFEEARNDRKRERDKLS